MKTLGLSLAIAVLLEMTAPPAAWSIGPAGGGGGHVGGFGGGAGHLGSPGGVERLDPEGGLTHMNPIEREGPLDNDARLQNRRGFGDHRGRGRFGYPVCFAYPYCPSPGLPCTWQQGYWVAEPAPESPAAVARVWVRPGCY